VRFTRVALARLAAAIVWAALTIAFSRYAYFRIFSVFSAADDEGYVMQSIRSYLDGHALFDEVTTLFGPGYFTFESVIHEVLGLPLTHDFERFVTMALWLATTAACAAIVYRCTRSMVLALLASVQAFLHLVPLVAEPGHPQALLVLLIALTSLLLCRGESIGSAAAISAGIFTALAVLTKVNVGGYLLLGVAIPLTLAVLPRFPFGASAVVPLLVGAAVTFVVARAHVPDWGLN
jgi:hypothetical protein